MPVITHSKTEIAVELLSQLIAQPSFSREEEKTADLLCAFFQSQDMVVHRHQNNVWIRSKYWRADRPCLLLNSHHDTVKPVVGWTRNPFEAKIEGDRLYGLGSNDAGGPLVALIQCFLYFYDRKDLACNLIFAATAEEEISGQNGITSILDQLGKIDAGIIGEPTQMRMAIAERGLMVIDAQCLGRAGHAARSEGINALYLAMEDIDWIRNFQFPKFSEGLGATQMTITQIQAGHQHNVVPATCDYVIDVRTNECYSNREVFTILEQHLKAQLKARSFRLNSSRIERTHPLVQAGLQCGMETYASPTLSDQALLYFPTIKLGCGASARSHTADEYIQISEIESGIKNYIQLVEQFQQIIR